MCSGIGVLSAYCVGGSVVDHRFGFVLRGTDFVTVGVRWGLCCALG